VPAVQAVACGGCALRMVLTVFSVMCELCAQDSARFPLTMVKAVHTAECRLRVCTYFVVRLGQAAQLQRHKHNASCTAGMHTVWGAIPPSACSDLHVQVCCTHIHIICNCGCWRFTTLVLRTESQLLHACKTHCVRP